MIQRIQSIWLLLAALLSFAGFRYPFYTGTKTLENGTVEKVIIDGGYNLFIMLLSGFLILFSVAVIFFYRDRKFQLKLGIAGIILSLLLIFLYFNAGSKIDGTLSLWSIFTFGIPVCYVLAARGIWKDEQVVKSLDRLR
ncbi:MAG: DUF4293 family protein [Terrimonas sp.]|nr:DUF4293 family protein [Terrimonas sp.]